MCWSVDPHTASLRLQEADKFVHFKLAISLKTPTGQQLISARDMSQPQQDAYVYDDHSCLLKLSLSRKNRAWVFAGHSNADFRVRKITFAPDSSCKATTLFSPEPTREGRHLFHPAGVFKVDAHANPWYYGGDGYFAPAPFFFSLRLQQHWIGMGVCCSHEILNFWRWVLTLEKNSLSLELDYEPQGTSFTKDAHLPTLYLNYADTPIATLQDYSHFLSRHFLPPSQPQRVGWWAGPSFCGWGEQCYQARRKAVTPAQLATQQEYEEYVRVIDELDFTPRSIIIDDKWQKYYGHFDEDQHKWPSLQQFIARQHNANRKVLLWLPIWRIEGLDDQECFLTPDRQTRRPNPLNEHYQHRVQQGLEYLLSPRGLNADGLKIDFIADFSPYFFLTPPSHLSGIILLHRYLKLIYDVAKSVKSDALIITHTPNPFFRDVCDMLRLNDTPELPSITEAMSWRAQIAHAACPQHLLDSDDWPMPSKNEWFAYAEQKRWLAVPSIYYLRGLEFTNQQLSPQDWQTMNGLLSFQDLKTSTEFFPVVDEQDNFLDSRPRQVVHQLGLLHRSAHVILLNSKRELLIQKRAPNKESFPNCWDLSAGGHLAPQEEYLDAARRELAEELGLQPTTELGFLDRVKPSPETQWEHTQIFLVHSDDAITINQEEISDVRWILPSQLDQLINTGSLEVTPALINGLRLLHERQLTT